MKTLVLKVDEKISAELDLVKQAEGLGNRTSAFTFLIKYYLLTKGKSLDNSVEFFNKILDKFDIDSLPSPEDQLKDV